MWQVVWALVTVFAAIALLRGFLQAGGFGPPKGRRRRLRVMESVSLGGRQRLHVVDVGGEELLLSTSEGGVQMIRRLAGDALETESVGEEARPKEHAAPKSAEESRAAAPGAWGDRLRVWARPALWVAVTLFFSPDPAAAATSIDTGPAQLAVSLGGLTGPEGISSTLEIVALFTLISVAPSLLLMGTCFTRIFIVLTLLRQALGINQIPPNQVMAALALFTTFFVMAPVGEQVYSEALHPYMEREIDAVAATERAFVPVRGFLLDHTREKDLQLFVELSDRPSPEDAAEVSFSTLLPAYMISEMRTAFEIGFMIYLPFLVIDLVIASMLISLGMIVLPPMMIALPFKLMLFVLLDGWNLVLSSLVTGLL